LVTSRLLGLTFNNLPSYVISADDLLKFASSSRKDRTLKALDTT